MPTNKKEQEGGMHVQCLCVTKQPFKIVLNSWTEKSTGIAASVSLPHSFILYS